MQARNLKTLFVISSVFLKFLLLAAGFSRVVPFAVVLQESKQCVMLCSYNFNVMLYFQ